MKVGERIYTEAEVQKYRAALNWIVGFCESVGSVHTGFVHIKRRAQAALEPNTESSYETAHFRAGRQRLMNIVMTRGAYVLLIFICMAFGFALGFVVAWNVLI